MSKGEGTFGGNSRMGMMMTTSANGGGGSMVALVYNLGVEFVLHLLQTLLLVHKYRLNAYIDKSLGRGRDHRVGRIRLILLAYNPETWVVLHLLPNGGLTNLEGARDHMR